MKKNKFYSALIVIYLSPSGCFVMLLSLSKSNHLAQQVFAAERALM